MSAEEPLALGGPERPLSHRVRIANALYDHAKWVPNEINYWLDRLLAEHAHELAEKVRLKAKDCPWGPCQACEIRLEDANLIDPLKES